LCIATDHAPHARHEKDVPFEDAPFGVTGLETSFAALYTSHRFWRAHAGSAPRADVFRRASVGIAEPARIGARANLVTLDHVEWTVTEAGFRSLSALLAYR
jgi:dihydroorotase